jgi:excisionase family DNA binding protein
MNVNQLDQLPDVLTVPEVARLLRLGRNTAYEAVRCGELPSVRIRGRILVPKAALVRFLTEAADEHTGGERR